MDPETTKSITSFHLLQLPQELRDDIYEAAVFDLSPPEMFMFPKGTNDFVYRNMNTNILLTNRKTYREARDVIIRRGQLVMVSATRLRHEIFWQPRIPVDILTSWSGISVIHPKYRNLCIMNHRINSARSSRAPNANDGGEERAFIVHQRDIKSFCQALMGKFHAQTEVILGPKSTHTLMLYYPPGYAQNECMGVSWAQTRVLQEYRSILRGFENVSILGHSIGWEGGLYLATLNDIRSIDGKVAGGFINDLRHLETEGSDTLLHTGDFEAADAWWVKALGLCGVARESLLLSYESSMSYYEGTSIESNAVWWAQLRREKGDTCAVPIIDFWYRLIRIRLSGVLRLIQRGEHLATKHGRAPRPILDFVRFVARLWEESKSITSLFNLRGCRWLPPPFEEAQLCVTVAAIYRLLDVSIGTGPASTAIVRAVQLAFDDKAIKKNSILQEAIFQEESRVYEWIWTHKPPL